MIANDADELTRILDQHRQDVEAAKLAAKERAHEDEDARHACEAPIRSVAVPLFQEWSKRLAFEGYPTSVDDRLGCRPPSVVFRFTPRGNPESSLTLACEPGPSVCFRMTIEGKPAGADVHTPLDELRTSVALERLSRFLTAALKATIPRRSDCGPPRPVASPLPGWADGAAR